MNGKKRIALLMLIDAFIVLGAVTFAYILRFEFRIPDQYLAQIPYVVIGFSTILLFVNYYLGIYRRLWRYASIGELIALMKSVALTTVLFFAVYLGVRQFVYPVVIPLSIFLMNAGLLILFIGGSRLTWRIFMNSSIKLSPNHHKALIVGAGDAGTLVAKELMHNEQATLYPVAFVDDDETKHGLEVMGSPVLGGREAIPFIVEKHQIDAVIIAIPSGSRRDIRKIFDVCKQTGAQVKILPNVSDVIEGNVSVQKIRDVSVEDLLGRDPVQVDLEGIMGYVRSKCVLVTGAGGSIGSELCRQVSQYHPQQLILLGHGENSIYTIEMELRRTYPDLDCITVIADVQDRERMEDVFATFQPYVVFHAAAHKHVPLMESNPVEAIKNNIFGTRNVAECADKYHAERFVLISTDKAVNPTSIMGATKRVAEMIVQTLNKTSLTKFTAVRFGNVLGSRGSVIPLFKEQIRCGGPVTVTHPEMIRYFMTIPEAVQLVIQAGALTRGGEVFILDMGEPVKIADLAKDLIQMSGLKLGEDIEIEYTGIRPGEKLYEEILTAEEGATSTKHERIFIGRPTAWEYEDLEHGIRSLGNMFHLSPAEIKGKVMALAAGEKEEKFISKV